MATFIFGLPNSVDAPMDGSGWTEIPFGMWPHSAGYQRFGQKEAEAIVSAFKGVVGRFKRAICGSPVYKGHPDNPEMANQYPDKTVYGAVSDMEVRDTGLAIKQTLFPAGATLVANGLDRISPNWFVRDTGEKKNERPIYEPTSIKSIGLVKRPNIPNLSLVNSKPEDSMKDLLIKLLALSNEATDEQILAAVTERNSRPLPETLSNAKNELAVATGKVADLTSKLATETARADEGAKALANEKKSQVTTLVNEAIKSGKIAEADKATWETILSNDLEAGRKILANVKPAMKTKEKIRAETAAALDKRARAEFANAEGAGEDGADPAADGMVNRGQKIQKLVNAEMESLKNCGMKGNALRNKAWANVKTNMPGLFSDHASDDADETTTREDGAAHGKNGKKKA